METIVGPLLISNFIYSTYWCLVWVAICYYMCYHSMRSDIATTFSPYVSIIANEQLLHIVRAFHIRFETCYGRPTLPYVVRNLLCFIS